MRDERETVAAAPESTQGVCATMWAERYAAAHMHITQELQPGIKRLAEQAWGELSPADLKEANRLATWWHGNW